MAHPVPTRSKAARLVIAGVSAAALAVGLTQIPAGAAPPVVAAAVTDNPDDQRFLGDTPAGVPNVDLRGAVEPSVVQRQAAKALGASVQWNRYGTPSSLLPDDGSLGTANGSAVEVARTWLRRNRTVFGLSQAEVGALSLVNNQRFAQSAGRAVLFRQSFGDLTPAIDSMVTVGVKGNRVAYVSSSLAKNTKAPASTAGLLSPEAGWLAAARAIGGDELGATLPSSVGSVAESGGWTRFQPARFAQQQQARLRALVKADGTVVPVIEANVVNVAGGRAAAYTVLVDASSGAGQGTTLWRRNQVNQLADPAAVLPMLEDNPAKKQFSGEITATDCGPQTPFDITDDDTRTIVAAATALNPANDIVLKLYDPNGQLLTSGDTATSPEAITYSPPGGAALPQGTYNVQVCPFPSPTAPFTAPGNYVGNVAVFSQSGATGSSLPYPPKWSYFATNPTPVFTAANTPKNQVTGCWTYQNGTTTPTEGCTDPAGPLRNLASRSPWDVNPSTELPTFTTLGNNASDREAWLSPLTPGGFGQAPVSPDRAYLTGFTDQWNNQKCDPSMLTPGTNGADVLFSAQNLFVAHNKMHDFSYFLGFNEGNYNMQQNNFGNGGVAGDPEIGNVQAGAATGGQPTYQGRDNANQISLQDGIPGITNQYLFQPIAGAFYAPCADGGLDMGIVGHEYTHAISNRMIGGPDEGITSNQGGAMGESWGDLVAAEFQFSNGYDNGGNNFAVGIYATGNRKTAIRNYAMNRSPLTYGEVGYDSTGQQVHADGEIWSATQWRVRQALVDKYNNKYPYANTNRQVRCAKGQPNYGPIQPFLCPGNRRWIQIMFDAFLLQQGATDMLQARDAMIGADSIRFNGANRSTLWKAFARSGMGVDASTPNADSEDVTPGFAAPSGNRSVRFVPTLPNGDRVAGQVFIGSYEARATPVADTLPKTRLDDTVTMTPGTYPALFQSKTTGLQRFTLKVSSGGATLVKQVGVRTNLASDSNGATVAASSPNSRNPEFLIDNTEATNWGGVSDDNIDVTGKQPYVIVDLAGDGVSTIRRAVVSAMLRPAPASPTDVPLLNGKAATDDPDSGSRFTALRQFRIDVCTADCGADGAGWKPAYTSPGDAFPAVLPRPVSPNLNFRTFTFPAVKARFVRLVALENQCTGYAGYAGDQDNDPTNQSDCKTGSDRGTIVHAAELEVFER